MNTFGLYIFCAALLFLGLIAQAVMIIGKGSATGAFEIVMPFNNIIVITFFVISAVHNKRKQRKDTENKTD